MKRQSANPNTNSLPRCSHVFPSGRRCRSTAPGTDSPFCHRHRPKEDPGAELVRNLPEFHSVADVTVFLSRLIFALSKDQISTRRASVLSYVAVSLMHGFRSLQQEHQAERGELRFDPLPWTWTVTRSGPALWTLMTLAPSTLSITPTKCAKKPNKPWPEKVFTHTITRTPPISCHRTRQTKTSPWPKKRLSPATTACAREVGKRAA